MRSEAELWAELAETTAREEREALERAHGQFILDAFKARDDRAVRENPLVRRLLKPLPDADDNAGAGDTAGAEDSAGDGDA